MVVALVAVRLANVCVPVKVLLFCWKQVPPIERQPVWRVRPLAKVEVALPL